MQSLILVLFIGLFLHDALLEASSGVSGFPLAEMAWPWMAVVIFAPKLLLGGVYHLLCRRVLSKLGDAQSRPRMRKLERFSRLMTFGLMASFLTDLGLGGLVWIRRDLLGDWVLIDELLFLLPTLALMAWTWFAYYPLDRAMREAALMGRLDGGQPVQIWTRGQYMLANVRHQWVLLGVPLLLLSSWSESVQRYIAPNLDWSPAALQALTTGGALLVFVFTSVMIRYLWDTVPLPDGELRTSLVGMCKQYRVGVRELLLWRTFGGMVNGAVMGLFSWVRYILLTDALLESLSPKQVQAVMAHELAHVRKHHMFWMVIIAAGSLELLRLIWTTLFHESFELMSNGAIAGVLPDPIIEVMQNPNMAMISGVIVSMACWFFVFGWVSRRFERQADTFAVQHMAREWHQTDEVEATPIMVTPAVTPAAGSDAWVTALSEGRIPEGVGELEAEHLDLNSERIPVASANVMIGALQAVADLNCIPTARPSWRHGSIQWRQDYLRDIAGKSIEDTDIDRQVLWIKFAGVVGLATLVVVYSLAG